MATSRLRLRRCLTTDAKANWVRNAYRQARERLDELMGLLAGRQDAIRDNERDQAELAKLQAKVQAAHEAYRAECPSPKLCVGSATNEIPVARPE